MGLASKMAASGGGQARPASMQAPPANGSGMAPLSTMAGGPSAYGAPPSQPPTYGQAPGYPSTAQQQQQQPYGQPEGYGASSAYRPPVHGVNNPFDKPPVSPISPQNPHSPYGQPPSPFVQQQPSPYGQQPPSHYAAPPGPPPGRTPSVRVAPGGVPTVDPRAIESILVQCIQDQGIAAFYPPGSLGPIAQKIAASGALDTICQEWRLAKELGMDLIKLALFDIIILVDDSGSMAFEEGGERIDDLKLILSRCAFAASLFDDDGIQVRFLNSNIEGNGITSEAGATQLLNQIRYSGLTPLGTSLDRKILQPLVLGPARAGQLKKPVLVICITDGTPAGEPRDLVLRVIVNANEELRRTRYGPDALSLQFAQVGTDMKAQAFLAELDTHPQVGGLVDCTSNYEAEADEMMRKSGMELTPELWLLKLLMGGIDSSYDAQDE